MKLEGSTFAVGQKCVEAQNEFVVATKKVLDSVNNTRSIDAALKNVIEIISHPRSERQRMKKDVRLRLEILHDVQEFVVNVRTVVELDLYL